MDLKKDVWTKKDYQEFVDFLKQMCIRDRSSSSCTNGVVPSWDYATWKMCIRDRNIPTCQQTLGIVNGIYRPKDVIDYIGNPKPNRYQSLHSVITYKTNKDALVKIRTKAMDLKATYGVSHQEYSTMGGQKLFQGLAEVDNTYREDVYKRQDLLIGF